MMTLQKKIWICKNCGCRITSRDKPLICPCGKGSFRKGNNLIINKGK